jgi:hypothetical protein
VGAALLASPALLLASAGPAAAADGPGTRCADGDYFVIEYTASYQGSTPARDGEYERAVPTRGGCASSWAHGDGQLSTAAIVAQCRTGIEPRFGDYPFTVRFLGAASHPLRNRADCIQLMLGVSSGEIDPGVLPLFPGGKRP